MALILILNSFVFADVVNLKIISAYRPDTSAIEQNINDNNAKIANLNNQLENNKIEFWNISKRYYNPCDRDTRYYQQTTCYYSYNNYNILRVIGNQRNMIDSERSSLTNSNRLLINQLNKLKDKIIILALDRDKSIYLINTDQIHYQSFPMKAGQAWIINGTVKIVGNISIIDLLKADLVDAERDNSFTNNIIMLDGRPLIRITND